MATKPGPHRHDYLQVAPALKLCSCGEAQGALRYQKGATDEALRLIEKAGGFDAVRARLAREKADRFKQERERKDAEEKAYMSAGRYVVRPLTEIPPYSPRVVA